MKLLCKLVTNLLKTAACAHPINLCNSLGSGLSDLHHCDGCGRGPWLEWVINVPFLPVALSWRPSLFPLGDSDIGHNKYQCCFRVNCSHLVISKAAKMTEEYAIHFPYKHSRNSVPQPKILIEYPYSNSAATFRTGFGQPQGWKCFSILWLFRNNQRKFRDKSSEYREQPHCLTEIRGKNKTVIFS